MKSIKIVPIFLLSVLFLFGTTACLVVRTDNGNHRGWYKNTNNPHNPLSTNPGRGHGHGK
ncbi:MAG: hypothetical protein ACXVNM_03515 [Bacteroidia bacterium]